MERRKIAYYGTLGPACCEEEILYQMFLEEILYLTTLFSAKSEHHRCFMISELRKTRLQ